MKPISEEYEIVDDQPWVLRNPGPVLTMLASVVVAAQFLGTYWVDKQMAPQFEKIHTSIDKLSRNDRTQGTLQIETARHWDACLAVIADSANVKMPKRPKDLDRAEERVRQIVEGGS